MTRIFLRVLLTDGRWVVVRDPDRWTILQEEVAERTYVDLSPEEQAGVQTQVTTVQVVADSGEHTVVAEFDSLNRWLQRGSMLHRTPLWLPGWLVASLNAHLGKTTGYKTMQELVTELLTAALGDRERSQNMAAPPLFLRIYANGRVFVVHSPPEEPWGYIQEEVAAGAYRDIPAEDVLGNAATLASNMERVEVLANCGWGANVVVGRFSREEWLQRQGKKQVITLRLPGWLVWQLDEIKKRGGGPRRKTVEEWLVGQLGRDRLPGGSPQLQVAADQTGDPDE